MIMLSLLPEPVHRPSSLVHPLPNGERSDSSVATNLPVHDMDSFALPEVVDLYVDLLKRLLEDPKNDELREVDIKMEFDPRAFGKAAQNVFRNCSAYPNDITSLHRACRGVAELYQ